MTRKPSMFYEEKRLIQQIPFILIVTAILTIRLIAILPHPATTRLFNLSPVTRLTQMITHIT